MIPTALIRLARVEDLPAINAIYNHYVLHSTCTYQEETDSLETRRAWFDRHGEQHPVIIAEVRGKLVGWGALSAFHLRSAYRKTVENAVYIDPQELRCGYGRAILGHLISRAKEIGHHSIIALVDGQQPASVALHEALGFTRVGQLKEAGYKFSRWLDVIYMQKLL